jgi:AcrR family transcriptional regulator
VSGSERLPDGRARAVEAFIELVAERGYQQVELDEIDERAGLKPGSAGRLFPDRISYFHAGWDLLEAGLVRRLRSAYQPVSGWRNQLRAAADETAKLLERFPAQAHFLAVDALSVGDQGRERQQYLAARLAVYLDQARAESEDSSAPAATSGWVMGLFFDRIYRCSASGREGSFAAELPELMFLAVSAYFGPEAGLAELEQNVT